MKHFISWWKCLSVPRDLSAWTSCSVVLLQLSFFLHCSFSCSLWHEPCFACGRRLQLLVWQLADLHCLVGIWCNPSLFLFKFFWRHLVTLAQSQSFPSFPRRFWTPIKPILLLKCHFVKNYELVWRNLPVCTEILFGFRVLSVRPARVGLCLVKWLRVCLYR